MIYEKPSVHLTKRGLRWGTVWGTIVPKHDVFDPKKRLKGRAKLLISEQQAPGLSNLLNRCTGGETQAVLHAPSSRRDFVFPPAKQVSAILVNKADFFFFVYHRLDDPLKQQQEDLGLE
jgi:hypothetical protein